MQKIEHFSFRPIPEKEQTDLISVIVAVYNIEAYLENASDPYGSRHTGTCRLFWLTMVPRMAVRAFATGWPGRMTEFR